MSDEKKEPGWLLKEMFGGDKKDEDEKREGILAKVRYLMEMASRADTPPNEAENARKRADLLMTKYAIDNWNLQQTGGDPRKPLLRWFDFQWWEGNQFQEQLYWMFTAVATHCRCKPVITKLKREYSAELSRSELQMPVVGLESDLDWFDLLFTNLMITMVDKVDPRASSDLSVEENMARMREAGLPWGEALNRLALAGVVPSLAQEFAEAKAAETGESVDYRDDDKYRMDGKGQKALYFSKKVYERTITAYRTWCKQTGHPQSYVSQVTFRRNFANGFAAEVTERLARMRRESEAAYDQDNAAGSMALAVLDIKKVIEEEVYNLFPDLRPHPSNCDCDKCHYCHNATCNRPNCKSLRDWKPVRTRTRAPKAERIDYAARDAGRAAGREVNLSNKPSDRIGRTKGEINP